MAYENRKNYKRILTILKLKWRIFYMRYVKIIVLAIMEVIAELYLRDKK